MLLSKTSVHAIRAMICLAELPSGTYAGTQKLAELIGAPPNYLGKLLQQLGRSGLVHSQKGLGGGFCLARPAAQITLLAIVEPLEQTARWHNCMLGLNRCGTSNPCPIHDRWGAIRDAYLDLLATTTIATLAHNENSPLPDLVRTRK